MKRRHANGKWDALEEYPRKMILFYFHKTKRADVEEVRRVKQKQVPVIIPGVMRSWVGRIFIAAGATQNTSSSFGSVGPFS